jgi:hypothetical protein
LQIRESIDRAVETGEPTVVRAKSIGKNKEGATVAEFYVTWSFKRKAKVQSSI